VGKSITNLSSVTTVDLDLAKHAFQVHGVDTSGRVIVAKALRRKDVLASFAQLPQCIVGMEACSSAHHWALELVKLGHDARMMPPAYVKPYVRRQKNDAADAAGICEAVTRPSMRFTGVRTLENQAALMHHKAREMLVTQRTQLINALRGDAGHPPSPARTMLAYRCRSCTASTAAFTRRSTSWLAAR
jgi:transposase